jgi:flagellar operon protein
MVDKVLPGQTLGGIGAVRPATPGSAVSQTQTVSGSDVSFRQLLDESLRTQGGVKFSSHALKRLESRGIALGTSQVSAVEAAVNRAAAKGSRDSLLMGRDYAMLVNIPSRTVITALDQQQLAEQVVTNIDSAIWVTEL